PLGFALLLAAGGTLVLLALDARALPAAGLLAVGLMAALPGLRHLLPDGTLVARPGLPAAVAAMGVVSVAVFCPETLLPPVLTVFRGQSATVAGLALSAASLTWTARARVPARAARARS